MLKRPTSRQKENIRVHEGDKKKEKRHISHARHRILRLPEARRSIVYLS